MKKTLSAACFAALCAALAAVLPAASVQAQEITIEGPACVFHVISSLEPQEEAEEPGEETAQGEGTEQTETAEPAEIEVDHFWLFGQAGEDYMLIRTEEEYGYILKEELESLLPELDCGAYPVVEDMQTFSRGSKGDEVKPLQQVLTDITRFYQDKGSRPIIYQSMLDDNWFGEIQEELSAAGFKSWIEDQEYMLPAGENRIIPNPDIIVRKVSKWSIGIENVFIEAEEPWEIKVAKKTLDYPEAWMFAACLNGKVVGLLYGHISERVCRVDYLIVSRKHRKAGVGRTLFYNYVEWCRLNGIDNVYIWPDGEIPKRIYEEGGYRVVEVRKAGRAVMKE